MSTVIPTSPTVKEEKTKTNRQEKVVSVAKPSTLAKKVVAPVTATKPVLNTVIPTPPTQKKEVSIPKDTTTPAKKVVAPVTLTKPVEAVTASTAIVKTSKNLEPKVAETTKKQDLEEIDSLMEALKDRDSALKNRDELELRIQQLIKKALDNRFKAIAYMNKEELRLLELQKELLDNRDIAYKKIGQINTPKSGE